MAWVGYEVQLEALVLGISLSRARWAVEWLRRVARDGITDVCEFRAALGRLSFVAGALEWEKPFLAPLFSFASRHPRGGMHVVPLYVRVLTKFLSNRIERRRSYPSAMARVAMGEAFRVDAKAEGNCIGIGGWLPKRDTNGQIATELSPWFAVELDKESAPWAYHRGEPFRAIAALEALGALFGAIAFRNQQPSHSDATIMLPGVGDNRGIKFALSRLQTSKFLCAAS